MGDINIHGIPNAGVGYSLAGKKIMVHDPLAALADSTRMVDPSTLAGTGGYKAPMWKEADGDMVVGSTTFQNNDLIGATEMNMINVNHNTEYIDDDYTFDILTGTIDRSPNQWQVGDKMVTQYKSA